MTLFFFGLLHAQQVKELDYYKSKYPDTKVVYAYKVRNVDIQLDGKDQIKITEKREEARMNLSSGSVAFPQQSVGFNSFDTINSIEAYVSEPGLLWKNRNKVREFFVRDNFQEEIFHTDAKSINFKFSPLQQGATATLEYERLVKEPRFLHSFHLAEFIPVDYARLKIKTPSSVELGYECINCKDLDVEFEQENKWGNHYYTWSAESLSRLEDEENAPGYLHYAPHIVVYIKKVNGRQPPELLSTTYNLYSWYVNLLASMDNGLSPELQSLTDSLVKDSDHDLEIPGSIYSWIHKNIKYIALEDGLNGFIPRNANKVFERRYGDCKDMSNLFKQMVQHAGEASYLTWIGTRELPYDIEHLPVPQACNHMIIAYPIGNQDEYIFIDGTATYLPFGMPSHSIQGKKAMIGLSSSKYKLRTVPEVPASKSVKKDSVYIYAMEGGGLKAKGRLTATGYEKQQLDYAANTLEPETRNGFMEKYLQKGNNSFSLTAFDISPWEPSQSISTVAYEFDLSNHWVKSGNKMYVNLFLKNPLAGQKLDSSRTLPRKNPYKNITQQSVVMPIPDNYRIKKIPQNTTFKHELFEYDLAYAHGETDLLKFSLSLEIKFLELQPKDFDAWNKMIDKLNKDFRNAVTLIKINNDE